jgi:hypothetical protein
MGDILLSTHQGTVGGLRPETRKWFPVYNARDTYGGIFGPGALPGGWEGEKKFQRDGYLVNNGNYCLAKLGEIYAIYLPRGGNVAVRLVRGHYRGKWFSPVSGQTIDLRLAETEKRGVSPEGLALSEDEQTRILRGTAIEAYRL